MKYSMAEYSRELAKVSKGTCMADVIDELMAPYREMLYQGLEIGDGVTVHLWSDAHACTIVARTKTVLYLRRDKAIRTDRNGMSDCQAYRYEPDDSNEIFRVNWSRKQKRFLYLGNAVTVGRHEYYDYSF